MSEIFQNYRVKSLITVNGSIDPSDIATKTFVSQYIQLPSGVTLPFSGTSVPPGYLLCDGAEVMKQTYPSLYNTIGNKFGTSSSPEKFVLPNMQNKFIMGGSNIGAYAGQNEIQLTIDQLPEHTFDSEVTIDQQPHSHLYSKADGQTAASGEDFDVYVNSTNTKTSEETIDIDVKVTNKSIGKGELIDITPQHVIMNYIIKI